MPVYEYGCKKCKREFEYEQRMSDPPKTKCEACRGKLERLISRTSFMLKGGGWYKDLYSSSKPAESTSDGGGAAGTAATADASSTPSSSDAGATTPAKADASPAKKEKDDKPAAPKQVPAKAKSSKGK